MSRIALLLVGLFLVACDGMEPCAENPAGQDGSPGGEADLRPGEADAGPVARTDAGPGADLGPPPALPPPAHQPTDCSETACFYVDAQGGNSGACGDSWADACKTLPATLVRGTTYFVADGVYPPFTVDVPGTETIVIKKAIAADHGTAEGWSPAMGDGHARFTGRINIFRGHVVLDGQVGGGPTSWKAGHGFRVLELGNSAYIMLGNKGGGPSSRHDVQHVTIRHVELGGTYPGAPCIGSGVNMTAAGTHNSHVTLEYSYIHDIAVPLYFINGDDLLFSKNYIVRNSSSASCHSEIIATRSANRVVHRHSVYGEFEGTGGLMCMTGQCDGWEIYGNVFFHPQSSAKGGYGNGAIATLTSSTANPTNWKIYNNSFVNLPTAPVIALYCAGSGADIAVHNNLFVRVADGPSFVNVEPTYSYFADSPKDAQYEGANNNQVGVSDPLKDWRAEDFALAAPTLPGKALGAPYDVDMFGNVRGADGNWDRGAIELVQ